MRLIDADILEKEVYESKMQNPHKDAKFARCHDTEHDHFMRMIVLQPTIQNEIVQCKDCRFWKKERNDGRSNIDVYFE